MGPLETVCAENGFQLEIPSTLSVVEDYHPSGVQLAVQADGRDAYTDLRRDSSSIGILAAFERTHRRGGP